MSRGCSGHEAVIAGLTRNLNNIKRIKRFASKSYSGLSQKHIIEEGAKHLIELKNLIVERNIKEKQMPLRLPDLLIVLTGGELAYTREDGVKVIPLGTLRD